MWLPTSNYKLRILRVRHFPRFPVMPSNDQLVRILGRTSSPWLQFKICPLLGGATLKKRHVLLFQSVTKSSLPTKVRCRPGEGHGHRRRWQLSRWEALFGFAARPGMNPNRDVSRDACLVLSHAAGMKLCLGVKGERLQRMVLTCPNEGVLACSLASRGRTTSCLVRLSL